MSLESGIVALLGTSSALTALVSNRIYPVLVPETAVFPCLSYQVASASTQVNMDLTAVQTKRVQLDGWANSYSQVKQIEAALSALLDGYIGTLSDGTKVIQTQSGVVIDTWESDSRVYRVTVEYSVTYSA